MIDAVVRGTLSNKTLEVVQELFEKMAMNSDQWNNSRANLSKLVQVIQCDPCGEGQKTQESQMIKSLAMPNEHVDYMGSATQPQNNPYSNTYNESS